MRPPPPPISASHTGGAAAVGRPAPASPPSPQRLVPQPDPDKRRTLVSIEGEVPSLNSRPSGCEFHTRCKYATERCAVERPDETVLDDGRIVTCHHPLVG